MSYTLEIASIHYFVMTILTPLGRVLGQDKPPRPSYIPGIWLLSASFGPAKSRQKMRCDKKSFFTEN